MTIRPRCSAWRTRGDDVCAGTLRGGPDCARFLTIPNGRMATIMVTRARELRRKAALCRRVARIPTSGSGTADRILMTLAEQLEHEAALREQQLRENHLFETRPPVTAPGDEAPPAEP